MKPALAITSAQNPRVKAVVALRESRERRRAGLFVAEGAREIARALDAGLTPIEFYRCDDPSLRGGAEAAALAERCGAAGAARFEVTSALLSKMAYCENPEGVLAVFEQPRWTLDALPGLAAGGPELWLVAVGTEKPGNLGAMVRTADAAGAAGVLVAGGVVDAFNPNAIRASTGAVFTLPVVGAGDEETLAFLRSRGAGLFAAALPALGERLTAHTEADFRGPTAIVIGPEDTGLSDFWLDAARAARPRGGIVTIPMQGRSADSLNASNAAAVLLFEAVRQRGAGNRLQRSGPPPAPG